LLNLYARHGVCEYWIVDTNENLVDVMELGVEGFDKTTSYLSGLVSSSVLPQLAVDLNDIFCEVDSGPHAMVSIPYKPALVSSLCLYSNEHYRSSILA